MSETGPGIATLSKKDPLPTTPLKDQLGTPKPEEINQNHEIYTFKTKSGKSVNAIFYSAQEMPSSSELMTDKKVFVYGEKPKEATNQAWSETQEKIRNASLNKNLLTKGTYWWDISEAIDKENALFMVEATPKNVLDLAFTLGVESPGLRSLRAQISRGQMTDELLDFTDTIIAGKIIDADGNIRTEKSFEGEALTVLDLSGNPEAKKELAKRVNILSLIDKQQAEAMLAKSSINIPQIKTLIEREGESELEPKDLALVRVGISEPIREGGKLVLRSAFDTIGRPRTSIHTALNHVVGIGTAHPDDWANMEIVTIMPFDKVVELNGKPRSTNANDTYFDLTPKKPFIVPDGTVIVKPGQLIEGQLFERNEKGEVLYKKTDFTSKEVKILTDKLNQEFPGKQGILKSLLLGKLADIAKEYSNDVTKDSRSMSELLDRIFGDNSILDILKSKSLTELTEEITQQGLPELASKARLIIEGQLAHEVKVLATKQTLEAMGYKYMDSDISGNISTITSRVDQLKMDLLSARLGVPQMMHQYDPNFNTQSITNKDRNEIFNNATAKNISPSVRRMIYQMGLL